MLPPPFPPPPPSWLEVLLPKRRVFVSYHHAADQAYYNAFSAVMCGVWRAFTDTSLRGRVDSDDIEYVRQRICEEYITGSSCTVVLCGAGTRWRRFVDWEISATLDREHGLIGVQLPTNGVYGGPCHAPDRFADNLNSGYAVWTTWAHIAAPDGAEHMRIKIEEANAKPSFLIRNDRALRQRSGN